MTTKFSTDGEATNAIKKALRQAFPVAKFSVTRGGACIEWEDTGPTVDQIKATLLAANCVAVHVASMARNAALARPPGTSHQRSENTQDAFKVFEELRQRAEGDVANEDDAERQRRPSWGPPLIIEGELLATCVELGLLKEDDKPIARLWAEFADPKKRGTALREGLSSLPLNGIVCRGFELHAGTERGATYDILFEAQRDKNGAWRFGPRPSTSDYRNSLDSEWAGKVRELQRVQSGYYNMTPEVSGREIAWISAEIAEIEAKDQAKAAALYRRQQLRNRVVELGRDRVLDFAGAPGVQMALASRLWGHCFNCGKELTDPISLERGIGPDCLHHKIAQTWVNHDLGADVASNAFGIGMPEAFVTATLAAPRPLYRTSLDDFPRASLLDGRMIVYRRDGPGVIGIFNSKAEAMAWINAQPTPALREPVEAAQ